MSYFVYSPEALPNPEMMGKPGYTPDADYIRWSGVALPPVPKDKWVPIPDELETRHRQSWKDPWRDEIIPARRYVPVIRNADGAFAPRGVVVLDHEPTATEREIIEKKSKEINLRFRKKAVEFFEQQREIALARQGTYAPSPYVDECYEILNMKKPYSIEALMAQRDPGRQAATEIATAIADALKAERQERNKAAHDVAQAVTRNASPSGTGAVQKPTY